MIGRFASIARTDEQGVVRSPMPTDVLAPALRAAYPEQPALPADMLRLLRTLDRPAREH